ncbi:hypothetical protein F4680DRAFT_453031 [Xylaria scruposa]|nr:hypothetical protein F4680DRAFT_453031 [Xylaria scruposa]
MRYSAVLSSLFSTLPMLPWLAHALPQQESAKLYKRVDCDPISKYTTDWFIQNICNPPADHKTCLFYTRGLTKQAIELAQVPGSVLVTIWGMWDRSLYILNDVDGNPLRCIGKNDGQRLTYFENMSRAMATLCPGPDADVMDRDIHNVYLESIWGRVEFPRLMRDDNPVSQLVNHIEATNERGDDSAGFWDRPGTHIKRSTDDGLFAIESEKRATCGVGADVAVEIDIGGKWPVEW